MELKEKLKTMLMQNFGVTNKEHYGMLWYFLEWSIVLLTAFLVLLLENFEWHKRICSLHLLLPYPHPSPSGAMELSKVV